MDIDDYRKRVAKRRKKRAFQNLLLIIALILVLCLTVFAIFTLIKHTGKAAPVSSVTENSFAFATSSQAWESGETDVPPSLPAVETAKDLLAEAEQLALQYDYDGAIKLIQSDESLASSPEGLEKISQYQSTKDTLVRINPEEVTHVFFHSLIMDTSKAFDGDSRQNGYNQMMTTASEFIKIMESMYEKGYVLVRLHDLAYETTDDQGNPVFVYGDIMLPPGKKAFVLSQDDVCYYEYMEGDGFASRIVIGEDGYPTCEMKLEDGTVVTGDYDLVPILERFIQEHPDFSYKGARGVLAFTGYNGILGYRTDESYKDTNPTYEEDRKQAAQVAQCLKEHGWESGETDVPPSLPAVETAKDLLAEAEQLALQYDYDGAIKLIQSDESLASSPEGLEKISQYQSTKDTLVRINPEEVTHVFFHSLIMDTSKAFDGDSRQNGYNQMMTTASEFIKIMESMYEKGYVLVRLHDLAYETTDDQGNPVFVYGDIMLPPGKKAFVLSQDDVCYYEYMEGDGFASRIVIGEDGYPTCEMKLEDGTVVTGDYDLVPILERFIQEHPDFSYKGARGVLAFTGYNGILGYRTDESYKDTNPTYEEDRKQAAQVAQCLKEHGWELASHSWGHRNMGSISMEHFRLDCDKWEANVETLIGPTDIILFPFGSDIGSWKPYTDDNERFAYLKSLGFRYFCNVDASKPYWVQMGQDHFRQGRRNLDGYRMYYNPDSLTDLFDVSQVFDPSRPLPVPPM